MAEEWALTPEGRARLSYWYKINALYAVSTVARVAIFEPALFSYLGNKNLKALKSEQEFSNFKGEVGKFHSESEINRLYELHINGANVSGAGRSAQSFTGALKTSYNKLISAGLKAVEEGSVIKLFNAENKLVAEIVNNKLVFKYGGYGGDIVMVEGKSTAVFGRFNDPIHGGGTKEFIQNSSKVYETGANPNGINILNISDWTWAKNEAWVIESANRGDIIRFISDPTDPTNIFKNGISGERTVTGLEVQTLESLGYTWDARRFQFVK